MDFIYSNELALGLLVGACFFVPWQERRDHIAARLVVGVGALLLGLGVIGRTLQLPLAAWCGLSLAALLALIVFCFRLGFIHAVFSATCAYTVQHMISKIAHMIERVVGLGTGPLDGVELLAILILSSVVVCVPVYLLFTRKYLHGRELVFYSGRTVLFSALFLVMAVFLSWVLESNLDPSSPTFLTSYLALGVSCVLFALTILSLEITNCGVKLLETENSALERLLEKDKAQYEQARENMEKINIRYHDLKQQYSRVPAEERAGLEAEMKSLNLRYFTGNKALDIVITQKAAVCAEKDVQLICSADGEALGGMKSYHIYSLFGNAIDNAIECLEKVDDKSLRSISVGVVRAGDMVVIRVENYAPSEPVADGDGLATTKADPEGHGYGTRSIRGIAESYGGTADFFVKDHVFFLVVTLPCARLLQTPEE